MKDGGCGQRCADRSDHRPRKSAFGRRHNDQVRKGGSPPYPQAWESIQNDLASPRGIATEFEKTFKNNALLICSASGL